MHLINYFPQTPRAYRIANAPLKSKGEVGLYDLLQEIANMRLENNKLVHPAEKRSDQKSKDGDSQRPTNPSSSKDTNLSHDSESKDLQASRETRSRTDGDRNSKDRARDRGGTKQLGVIVISDSDDEDLKPSRQVARGTKQATLRLLTRRAREAGDNEVLADLLHQFLDMYELAGTRSRVVTRDAFEFLDGLVLRIEELSTGDGGEKDSRPQTRSSQMSESRTQSRDTSRMESTNSRLRQRVPAQKTETVKALRLRLQSSPSAMTNSHLSKLLAEFCQAVRATSGKTLTKDGVAFLESVETRLRKL